MSSYPGPYNQPPPLGRPYDPPRLPPTGVPHPDVGAHAGPQPLGVSTFAAAPGSYMLHRPPNTLHVPPRPNYVRKVLL
jgi:hypothetical protein